MRPPIEVFDSARHDRAGFRCGEASLDNYLARQATQDVRRGVAALFCVIDQTTHRVGGYYTLCATSIRLRDLSAKDARRLPPYPEVPAVLLGRLAVHVDLQRSGLGGYLVANAIRRSEALPIGAWCLVVDALHQGAADWYARYAFEPLPQQPLRLILPLRRPTPQR